MPSKELQFISSRANPTAQIAQRIENILWYTIECYCILLKEKTKYSKAKIRMSTINIEDYLKIEFVEKFLIPNKHLLKGRLSELEEINFEYETQKRYVDTDDGKEKPDKIDIYINKLGLRNLLSKPDEKIYFVFECKRIEILSDTTKYLADTEEFTKREYDFRLPFEGQIAFIENKKLIHSEVSKEINSKLKATKAFVTDKNLTPLTIHGSFDGSYFSVHRKVFKKKDKFKVFHLLFDYSGIVED